jgi:hypothetical protein
LVVVVLERTGGIPPPHRARREGVGDEMDADEGAHRTGSASGGGERDSEHVRR